MTSKVTLDTTIDLHRYDTVVYQPEEKTNEKEIDVHDTEFYDNMDDLKDAIFKIIVQTSLKDTAMGGCSGACPSEVTPGTDAHVQSFNPCIHDPTNGETTQTIFPVTSLFVLMVYSDFRIFSLFEDTFLMFCGGAFHHFCDYCFV